MAKNYTWETTEKADDGTEVSHTVSLTCSNITGKAIVVIDGDEYDISVKPFGLKGTNQVFRLGESPAVLDFPKKGEPTVTVDGEKLQKIDKR